jgi:hypothetical protein
MIDQVGARRPTLITVGGRRYIIEDKAFVALIVIQREQEEQVRSISTMKAPTYIEGSCLRPPIRLSSLFRNRNIAIPTLERPSR